MRHTTPKVGQHKPLPDLGLGVGLRPQHFNHVLAEQPAVDWFEVITENFMEDYGWSRHVLHNVSERYPVVFHGVSLSIGSSDPLNRSYLDGVKKLANEVSPRWVSDHLCWTGTLGRNSHDLLPLPFTEECLDHVAARVCQVQDHLERPLVLENPSSYVQFKSKDMTEWEFLTALTERTECLLLLDVNNVYVSARNHGFDPTDFIDGVPSDRIVQVHVAGHTDNGAHCIDTHDSAVCDDVWQLYAYLCRSTGPVSTLLEWDANIPAFSDLLAEVNKASLAIENFCEPLTWPTTMEGRPGEFVDIRNDSLSTPLEFLMTSRR